MVALPSIAYSQESHDLDTKKLVSHTLPTPQPASIHTATQAPTPTHEQKSTIENNKENIKEDPIGDIIRGLRDTGVTMYGTYWCGFCVKQLNMFGEHRPEVPYVECGIPGKRGYISEECAKLNIDALPTWRQGKDGMEVQGMLSLDALRAMVKFFSDASSNNESVCKEQHE